MTAIATRHGDMWVRNFGDGPARVVALHGFTLHGEMYSRLADLSGVRIAAPDLPGHGRSEITPVTIGTAVDAVAELLRSLPEPPLLLGYSQGGRVALQIALTHPDLVGSLMLIATSPGLNERARKLRRAADEGLASRIERIGIERFISEWLANPLVSTDGVDPVVRDADRALRLENKAAGLSAALRGMGQASVAHSLDRISRLTMPVDCVAGEHDERYVEHATAMADALSQRPTIVEEAGHNLILEAPDAIANLIRQRLDL